MSDQVKLRPPLIIEQRGPNNYLVRCGDRWERQLCADEALFVAAHYLVSKDELAFLKTKDQHQAYADMYRKGGNFSEAELLRMVEP